MSRTLEIEFFILSFHCSENNLKNFFKVIAEMVTEPQGSALDNVTIFDADRSKSGKPDRSDTRTAVFNAYNMMPLFKIKAQPNPADLGIQPWMWFR